MWSATVRQLGSERAGKGKGQGQDATHSTEHPTILVSRREDKMNLLQNAFLYTSPSLLLV